MNKKTIIGNIAEKPDWKTLADKARIAILLTNWIKTRCGIFSFKVTIALYI